MVYSKDDEQHRYAAYEPRQSNPSLSSHLSSASSFLTRTTSPQMTVSSVQTPIEESRNCSSRREQQEPLNGSTKRQVLLQAIGAALDLLAEDVEDDHGDEERDGEGRRRRIEEEQQQYHKDE